MKVFITQNNEITDVAVEIHCREIDSEVTKLNKYISNYDERIETNNDGEISFVELNDILYFESVDSRTFIYTANQVLSTALKLYEIEAKVADKDFFRCSKSVIVNVRKIVKLKPELTRNILATLTNGEIVVISRRYATAFKNMIREA